MVHQIQNPKRGAKIHQHRGHPAQNGHQRGAYYEDFPHRRKKSLLVNINELVTRHNAGLNAGNDGEGQDDLSGYEEISWNCFNLNTYSSF